MRSLITLTQIVNRPSRKRTMNADRYLISGISVVFLTLCRALTVARGQQTVFNVPTTDVLDKGKAYFELDISAKPNNSDALNKFSSFVPRVVVGAGGRVEVGLN